MRKIIFILIALISFSQAQTIQYIGGPTTTVISRGNFRTDSIFYLPKRTKTPTDTAAFRYQISDSSLYYWTGYQWTKVQSSSSFASVDTTVISTRAYRQKGDDSLGAIIATKGSGTVTSVATGYGLSGGTITTTGTLIADTALIASRLRLGKVADSLSLVKQNVLTNPVTGTGTTNRMVKFTGTSTVGNSLLSDNAVELRYTGADGLYVQGGTSGFTTIYGTGDSYLQFSDASGTAGRIQYNHTNDYMAFNTTSGGSSQERMRINSIGELLINTTTDAGAYTLQNNGALYNSGGAILAATSGSVGIKTTSPTSPLTVFNPTANGNVLEVRGGGGSSQSRIIMNYGTETAVNGENALIFSNTTEFSLRGRSSRVIAFYTDDGSGESEKVRITTSGESLFGTTTDAGNYRVQVSGNAYVTGDAILAASSGNVGIGTTSPETKLTIVDGSGYRMAIRQWSATGMEINAWDNAFQPTIPLKLNANYLSFHSGSPSSERIKIHANGGLKYVPQSAAPTAEAGTVYYDSDDNKLKVYNGTTWVDLH